MNYSHPGIATQHLINQAMNSKSMQTMVREQDKYMIQNMSPENYEIYLRKLKRLRESAPLSQTDETIVKLGSDVKHYKDGKKLIEKFNSMWTQAKLKQMKSDLTEADLFKDVKGVMRDCDLRGTTVQDLSSLKEIGGTLTVDTASQLKNLSGLEKVLGSVFVHAKNEAGAKEFLKSLGVNTAVVKGKIIPVIKNYL